MHVLACGCHGVDAEGGVWSRRQSPRWRVLRTRVRRNGAATQVDLHGRTVLVNWLVATAFVPNPQGAPQVQHADGDLLNNRATNLVWGTEATRRARMQALRRYPEGVRHALAKLDPERVRQLRAQHAAGVPLRQLARAMGVARNTVRLCVQRQTWKSVA